MILILVFAQMLASRIVVREVLLVGRTKQVDETRRSAIFFSFDNCYNDVVYLRKLLVPIRWR